MLSTVVNTVICRNKVISALREMQAVAQHHYHLIRTRLDEACVLVTKQVFYAPSSLCLYMCTLESLLTISILIFQVKNPRSEVAFEAMDTLAAMYAYLKKEMNHEVALTSQALLLKLADTSNDLIIERVNAVLDVMVKNCSHKRVLDALMTNGLR